MTEKLPFGFYTFHKNKFLNFQLNRWYTFGYLDKEDLFNAGKEIKRFEDNASVFKKLAAGFIKTKQLKKAATSLRAAEFLLEPGDPEKDSLYNQFIDVFYRAFGDESLVKHSVDYEGGKLHAFTLAAPEGKHKGTILMHGGFDSWIEEFYRLARYLNDDGYEIIAYEGPGQGGVLKNYGLHLDQDWENPTSRILDHFDRDDVTLLGLSLGGYWCLRAAAYEPRIKRVIASSVVYDLMEAVNPVVRKFTRWLMTKEKLMSWSIEQKMKYDPYHQWVTKHWMYITGENEPYAAAKHILKMNPQHQGCRRITQDVLILTGEKDHFSHPKLHALQMVALCNARSVTGRIFTKAEQAQNHCQVGNIGLALDVMSQWLNEIV